jgi:hypothetical protein
LGAEEEGRDAEKMLQPVGESIEALSRRDAEKMLQPVGESIEALSRRRWELPGAKTLARVGK